MEGELKLSYTKFVISAILRLAIGYLFLVNVFLAVVQSDRVLDMFYDMVSILNLSSMLFLQAKANLCIINILLLLKYFVSWRSTL